MSEFEPVRHEHDALRRRDFVKAVGACTVAGRVGLVYGHTEAAAGQGPAAETAVARLYRSLGDDQKANLCFPAGHPLQFQVANNWAVVRPSIADLKPGQRALCREALATLSSDDGRERFVRQMADDGGGLDNYHVAFFGQPDDGRPFEWLLTGRHVTLRADGKTGAASAGGPIFYGHAAGRPGNVWRYQAELADALFTSLDDAQKSRALVNRPRGPRTGRVGLPVNELDPARKAMVRSFVEGLVRPFRALEADVVQSCLRDPSGIDPLRVTYYRQGESRQVAVAADVWKLEGPGFSWYFHGEPHVHAWLSVTGSWDGA